MDYTFHPGVNGSSPWVEFYPYDPSDTAGYAFVAIFGILTIAHFILMFPYRAASFIPLVIGGICETFGYYGRAWSHTDRTRIGSWALQQMLILCAPPFIAATIYMILARIILAFNAAHHSPIRPKYVTVIFVVNDIICFLTQMAGAGVQITGDPAVMDIGRKAVIAGLVFALVVFGVFVWVAVVFHRRLGREPTGVLVRNPGLRWRGYMWGIYGACLAIMVRNLVRLVEFAEGKGSVLSGKEVYIYVFDAGLMAVAMGVLLWWHPGKLVKMVKKAEEADRFCEPMVGGGDVPLTGGYQRV